MFLPLEYIKYRWNAKGRHGIHSPYVYDFVDNCVSLKLTDQDKEWLNNLFEQLKNDRRSIEINDFGAGSKKLGSNRKISDIFKMSSSKGKYGELLYRIANHYEPENTLELGTSLGIGTTYFHLGHKKGYITTVEGCQNTRSVALENLSEFSTIDSHLETFTTFIDSLPSEKIFDLIFIDGHHDGDALIHYLNLLQKHSHDETIFILDDIRWSDSMKSAWETISNDPKFHLSLDLFRLGIVLKREHQEKEHFVIRY